MSRAYSSLDIDRGSQTRTFAPKCPPKSMRAKASIVVLVVGIICVVCGCFRVQRFAENRRALRSDADKPFPSLELDQPCDASSLEEEGGVIGLEYCPELEPMVPTFIEIKKSLLRLGIDAATGEPLLLLHPPYNMFGLKIKYGIFPPLIFPGTRLADRLHIKIKTGSRLGSNREKPGCNWLLPENRTG